MDFEQLCLFTLLYFVAYSSCLNIELLIALHISNLFCFPWTYLDLFTQYVYCIYIDA